MPPARRARSIAASVSARAARSECSSLLRSRGSCASLTAPVTGWIVQKARKPPPPVLATGRSRGAGRRVGLDTLPRTVRTGRLGPIAPAPPSPPAGPPRAAAHPLAGGGRDHRGRLRVAASAGAPRLLSRLRLRRRLGGHAGHLRADRGLAAGDAADQPLSRALGSRGGGSGALTGAGKEAPRTASARTGSTRARTAEADAASAESG